MDIIWVIVILQALICGFLCTTLAEQKGHSTGAWFAVGFFCGVFGLIAAAGLPTKQAVLSTPAFQKTCPDCAETIHREATVCKFCGKKFTKEQVVAVLLESLQEESPRTKLRALDALSAIKDESAIPHIVKLIETMPIVVGLDEQNQLLDKAIKLLVAIGTPNVSAELACVLKKTNSIVKSKKLVEALGLLRNPASVSVLTENLEEKSLTGKLQALSALRAIKDASAIPRIVKLIETIAILDESDENVQLLSEAIYVLVAIGTPNIPAELGSLLKKTNSMVKAKKLVEAFGLLHDPVSASVLSQTAIPQLERLAKEGSRSDRKLAAQIIETIQSSTST